ncbi:hypothetical protein TWF718_002051 [Orbilia javanica]|uniref:Uncharacterized protein n=1 Tax=Orbilia javanica TaxID=47235 RepID=A0AAN8MZT6_9PEZI
MPGQLDYFNLQHFRLTIFIVYYLVFWVGTITAKPDCNAENIVLKVQKDFDNLVKGCTELNGNLAISIADDEINIAGVERIRGNLFVKDGLEGLTNWTKVEGLEKRLVSFPNLTTIDGNFEVSKLGTNSPYGAIKPGIWIDTINVGGNVYIHDTTLSLISIWIGKCTKVTLLDNVDLYSPVLGVVPIDFNDLEVSANTLRTVQDEQPSYSFLNVVEMSGNIYVEASSLGTADQVAALNPQYAGLRMPKLERVSDVYIRQASFIELPSIRTISASFQLVDIKATKLECPDLTNIGSGKNDSFVLENALALFKVDMPSLETIQGDISFSGNNLLRDITGFGALKSVSGDMTFAGPIWSLSLPSLGNVDGKFTIRSTAPFNCTPWNQRQLQTRFAKGDYACESEIDAQFLEAGFDRNSAGQNLPGIESPAGPPSRVPMIAGASAGVVVAVVGIAIAIFFFRRRPKKLPDLLPGVANPELESNEALIFEADGKSNEIKAEAVGYIPPTEVSGDFHPVEMFVSDNIPVEIDGSEIHKPLVPPTAGNTILNPNQQRRDDGERNSWRAHDEAAFSSDRRGYLRDSKFKK